jgi:hypothetical protein
MHIVTWPDAQLSFAIPFSLVFQRLTHLFTVYPRASIVPAPQPAEPLLQRLRDRPRSRESVLLAERCHSVVAITSAATFASGVVVRRYVAVWAISLHVTPHAARPWRSLC